MQLTDLPLVTPAMPEMPKYRRIAAVLEEYLGRACPAPGEKFFTDRALAKHFSATTITVARSLNLLCSKGLLVRKVGSGTFVGGTPLRSLKRRIGIICHEMIQGDATYVTPVLSRFGAYFTGKGYDVISFCAFPGEYRRLVDEYELSGVMVFVPRVQFADDIRKLHDEGVPIVSIGYAMPGLGGISFGTDHEKSLMLAVEHLHALGHRKIALLQPMDHASSGVFSRGYRNAMWRHRLPMHPDWEIFLDHKAENLNGQMVGHLSRLLEQGEMPTAIVIGRVSYAATVYAFAQEHQLRIPEDLSLMGLGNAEYLCHMLPPLSVISQNLDKIADEAAQALYDSISGLPKGDGESAIEPVLIERGSCAPIKTSPK